MEGDFIQVRKSNVLLRGLGNDDFEGNQKSYGDMYLEVFMRPICQRRFMKKHLSGFYQKT